MENKVEIYQSANNSTEISVQFDEETVWLTQKQMSELFQTTPQNITIHLKNIFEEGELDEMSTCKDFLQVQMEGKRKISRKQKFYNLDTIVSIGYRVKSKVATQFRQWATRRLKDYLVQGYAINEKRLAQKQQEVEYLKTGIRILKRAIGQQATEDDSQMLRVFAKGLALFILWIKTMPYILRMELRLLATKPLQPLRYLSLPVKPKRRILLND
jgi:hypothetical protein